MAKQYTKSFSITGSANTTIFDTGLTSTEEEKRKLVGVIVSLSAQIGNIIEGWLEREKVVDLYDYVLNTHEASGTNMYKSVNKELIIPIDMEIPVGQTFKMAVKSGATAINLFGSYIYELL